MAVLRPDPVLQFGKYVTCDRIATTSGTMSLICVKEWLSDVVRGVWR